MKAKILVVDDEPDVVQLVEYNLKAAGYDVMSADDGTDATGQWYMWGTHTIGGEAMFLALNWDMHYRKTGGH